MGFTSKLPASTSDWLFQHTNWSLDTAVYKSAPSSLRSDHSNILRVLANKAACRVIPQGRIESWFYKEGSSYQRTFGFCVRNQYPTWTDGYEFIRTLTNGIGSETYFFKKDGVTLCTGFLAEPPVNTWFKRRLTFWESAGWFIMRYERWDGAAWVQDIADCLDPSPKYKTAAQNRCGLYLASHASIEKIRADDTVIYKPS